MDKPFSQARDQSSRSSPPPPSAFSLEALRTDFSASIVVFLVALPLCMGIAVASGAPVATGLISGILGGLVVGFLAGQPLQVSGPAAGLTVVVFGIIQEHGLATMGMAVLIGGVIQLLAGISGLGQWFRAVSPAVVRGMLSGIGALILGSQFHVMIDDSPKENGLHNLAAIPASIQQGLPIPEWESEMAREFRVAKLDVVGDLYDEQQQIQKRLSRVVPEQIKDDDAVPDKVLSEVVQNQAAVLQGLQQLLGNLDNMERSLDDPQKAVQLHESAEYALKQNQAALAVLKEGRVEEILPTQQAAVAAIKVPLEQLKSHAWAAKLGVLTILIIVAWQALTPKKLKLIPGPLIATLAVTGIAAAFVLPVLHVAIPDNLLTEGVNILTPQKLFSEDISYGRLLQSGIVIAINASALTLLCATAVDQLHRGARTHYDQELRAQGIGNIIAGFLGGLPMAGLIVRSSANVQAGAQTRLSAVLHGLWLLIFVGALGFVLQMIPTACLAGILVYTGWKLMNPHNNLIELWKYGKGEVVIYVVTASVIVVEDLLTGVLVGVVLSGVKLLYTFSHLRTELRVDRERSKASLSLEGSATFLKLPRLAAELERVPKDAELHVDLHDLRYIDHACLELFMDWAKQHESLGGKLVMDWTSLHARFAQEGGGGPPRQLKQASEGKGSRVA